MNVSAINSVNEAKRLLASETNTGADGAALSPAQKRKKEVAQAAKQFEAIILRQLISPAIEPLMSNGVGGKGKGGSGGGGVYGYMLTDVMADSLSKGGGLGLSKILEQQLTPKGELAASKVAAAYKNGKMNNNE